MSEKLNCRNSIRKFFSVCQEMLKNMKPFEKIQKRSEIGIEKLKISKQISYKMFSTKRFKIFKNPEKIEIFEKNLNSVCDSCTFVYMLCSQELVKGVA